MTAENQPLCDRLGAFLRSALGPDAEVTELRAADGHAGLTFLFAVAHGGSQRHYVLRLPPEGVRRKGNTDVYRQAPLLRALHAAGLPVPAIRWASPDEDWFGLPFIIMERLPGRTFLIWDPDPVFERSDAAVAPLWEHAARLLPAFHAVDWRSTLAGWEAPRALRDEIVFWRPMYERAPEPAWRDTARAVEALLLASIPADSPIGLVHGDYQLGNILFENGAPTGVIDWELAHIGAQTLDLGWLLMMADPQMWQSGYRALYPGRLTDLVSTYVAAAGREVGDAFWYQALAGYRFGAIACLNVKLHRKGQREDPLWEQIALSIPRLFGKARHILESRAGGAA